LAVEWGQPLEYILELKDMNVIWNYIHAKTPEDKKKKSKEEIKKQLMSNRKANLKFQERIRRRAEAQKQNN